MHSDKRFDFFARHNDRDLHRSRFAAAHGLVRVSGQGFKTSPTQRNPLHGFRRQHYIRQARLRLWGLVGQVFDPDRQIRHGRQIWTTRRDRAVLW